MTKKFEVDKDNLSKPFFAYGIFKPGQLAYSRLEEYVKGDPKECTVKHALYERDGIPFVKEDDERYKTHGYMIQFEADKEELAYNLITETESEKYYRWETTNVFDNEGNEIPGGANILFGKNPTQSNPFLIANGVYDGNNDICFKYGIRLITTDMKNYKKSSRFENFFKLQRNYLLLWTCIERYATLKYGKEDIRPNYIELAKEEVFDKSFKHFVKEKRVIHNSKKPTDKKRLDPEKPAEKSIDYYYQMRSNIAHRGKVLSGVDERKLRKSLVELLNIFQCVLEDTYEYMHFSRVDINIGDKEDSELYERFKLKSDNIIHDDSININFNLDSIDEKKILVDWLNELNDEIRNSF